MYIINHQGKLSKPYTLFVDAWFVAMDLKSFSKITGPDGTWVINPKGTN